VITKTFTVGTLSTNCYVTSCEETQETVIIDPGFDNQLEAKAIITFINDNALKLKFILNTHGHPDHTSGNEVLKKRFHVPVLIHENDACMLDEKSKGAARFSGFDCFSPQADILLHDGDSVKFGKVTLKVMHTPGHTTGSILLLDEKEVFTGDTLFAGSIGRVDLPGGSERDMRLSLKKLLRLSDQYVVYPGHGPTTTMGEEKRVNPFLQLP